jgi:putative ABC transport system permease protein
MSLWSRITNIFRGDRLNREIDEEFESHIQEAIEGGRDPEEVRRAFGSALRHREESRDFRLVTWLESLRFDAVFGWRQLIKAKVTSTAAILSLALAIGACTSAFRLIDALLLRPLPVSAPERLYLLSREGIGWDGKPSTDDGCEYPLFRQMRAAVKDQAELLAISHAERVDVTYKTDDEMEKVYLQYVSGWMFGSFGLRPALGRLLTEDDDLTPGAHAYAVISHDYWTHRFGQDPNIVGRTFRMGEHLYQIVGVAEEPFTGTEPGTMTDIFAPTMMDPYVTRFDASVARAFALLRPGFAVEPLRQKLQVNSRAFEAERAKTFVGMPQQNLEAFLNQTQLLEPASTGVSDLQNKNRRSLGALGVLVALVLLIACANVANLMTAQGAARAREMALRISIGAGRWRLVQLLLIESAWLALFAASIGAAFAWWSAPLIVSMINPSENPARVALPADWRVLAFGMALTLGATFLFGLAPALRASAIKPISALKGGENPHSRRRLMHALIAAQVAFCFLVLFVAGLFVATFERLSCESTGFSAERLLTLDTFAQHSQTPAYWAQVAEHLRELPGVEKAAFSSWALLDGNSMNSFISVNGAPPSQVEAYFLRVSPGWIDTMKIPWVDGRDFTSSDTAPGMAIVNETFVKTFFNGESPVGKMFARAEDEGSRIPFRIVGLVRDARYRSMREPIPPLVFVPFQGVRANGEWQPQNWGTFIVRTAGTNPLAMAQILRQEVPRARPEFRVSRIRTQLEINQSHTVRERLLAMLALFFAVVALVMAGVGLYGVLHYSVLQRQREIGIRIAIGAQPGVILRLVTVEVFSTVLAGALAGLALGMASVRYIAELFYQVNATELAMLLFPTLTILGTASLAALPAVVHAVRIDPATMLRAE